MRRCVRLLSLLSMLLGSVPVLAADAVVHLAAFEYPPYITEVDHNAQGLAVDIVREAFARLGRTLQIDFYPFTRSEAKLVAGEVDGFFTIKKNPQREQRMLFPAHALLTQDYVFFVRNDAHWQYSGNLDALASARLGVVDKISYGERFDTALRLGRFPLADTANSHEMNFRKLLAGRVDVVICSRLVGLYYLRMLNGSEQVSVSGPPVESVPSYLALSRKKDLSQLAQGLDLVLGAMAQDGTLTRLQVPYQRAQRRALPLRQSHP